MLQNTDQKIAMPTHEEFEAALRRARKLRAETLRAMGRAAWRRIFARRGARRGEALSALTALRAAAEALRDHPDTARDQRQRLLDIVLAQELRLERLLKRPA